ncbi:MAG: hypothetical protein ABW119_21330 [Candidatus Thiodiazotropha lotti]
MDVSNLKQAEDSYTTAFVCKKLRNQGPDMSVVSAGNCDLYLQQRELGSKPLLTGETVCDHERQLMPVHLGFLTQDVDEVVN